MANQGHAGVRGNRELLLLVLAFLMVLGIVGFAPPADAAYYLQQGTCSGTYTNWRGDYTTGYAYFGKTYSTDADCDDGFVWVYYNGGVQDSDWDDGSVISAVASSRWGDKTRHQLCWDLSGWPWQSCHTGHWLLY